MWIWLSRVQIPSATPALRKVGLPSAPRPAAKVTTLPAGYHRLKRQLKHLLAEHGLNAAGLSSILGASRNLGAMILHGERNLTLAHVRRLAAHFKVSPELFL